MVFPCRPRLSRGIAGLRVPRMRGMAQIEALVAVVVFAIGVLGIVGMQSRSVQMLGEATWRARAAQQAGALIAEMRTVAPDARARLYASRTDGARTQRWAASLREGDDALPGVDRLPPEVIVRTQRLSLPDGRELVVSDVTVTVQWQRPGAVAGRYVASTRIQDGRS